MFNSVNKIICTTVSSIIVVLVSMLFCTNYAYASGNAATLGGGGQSAASNGHWNLLGYDYVTTSKNFMKDDPVKFDIGDVCDHHNNTGKDYDIEETVAIIYCVDRGGCNKWLGKDASLSIHTTCGNFCKLEKNEIPSEFFKERYTKVDSNKKIKIQYVGTDHHYNGYLGHNCGRLVRKGVDYNSSEEIITAAWIDPEALWKPQKEEDTATVIEWSYHKKSDPFIDDRDKKEPTDDTEKSSQAHNKWLYLYGKTSASYENKTQPNEFDNSYGVYARVKTIKYTHTWKEQGKGANKKTKDHKRTYKVISKKEYKKTFKYHISIPTPTQEYYKPLNLNTNGFVKTAVGGLDSNFLNATEKLSASVGNERSDANANKNGDKLSTLDINNDKGFTFNFNNKTLGMPDRYNWDNAPSALANGDWESVNTNLGYGNGRLAAADSDGYFRSKLMFRASLSRANGISKDTSSLAYWKLKSSTSDAQEKLSSDEFKENYKKEGFDYNGGYWSARFNLAGFDYTTDNEWDKTKHKQWWINKYRIDQVFEYGVHYGGAIETSGIANPTAYSGCQFDYADEGNIGRLTQSFEQQHRGLYVGIKGNDFEQPVLYGIWEVKTLAGDVI